MRKGAFIQRGRSFKGGVYCIFGFFTWAFIQGGGGCYFSMGVYSSFYGKEIYLFHRKSGKMGCNSFHVHFRRHFSIRILISIKFDND